MAPLVLEGDTLGKKHQYYNKLVKESATNSQSLEPVKINIEECDVDNLLKIDIASNNRNVEYILEVLKCEDMLYVSRAIKRCTWLLSDQQYAYIINPEYLHSQLFPHMTTKATNKLMLHIRLYLRDEARVENFYHYYKEKNLNIALKWLPYCSLPLIENVVASYADSIKVNLFKRLCERSITILDIYVRKHTNYYRNDYLEATKFLLHINTEKYLDIIETLEKYQYPNFHKQHTEIIMKNCPNRIINNFDKYIDNINLDTFAKHLKKEEIKGFILKHSKNNKLRSFDYDTLKHFIRYMPKEGRFEFLKQVFIEKQAVDGGETYSSPQCDSMVFCYRNQCEPSTSSANIYRWYRFAQFDVAFTDLRKLIRTESSPDERNSMLAVLLYCAGRNLGHVQTLLQYYLNKHINEPFKFKNQFVNCLLSSIDTHKFDEKTWNILNELFHSMEVYVESDNNVQPSIRSIIVYQTVHDKIVPEIIEKKFEFNTLKKYQSKLNKDEKEKVFKYLYYYVTSKTNKIIISDESNFNKLIKLVEQGLSLLVDWKKELLDYPWLLNKIKEHIQIKKDKSWNTSLASLYNINKSWRKLMFEESLLMNPSEEVCINALKHDPDIFSRYKSEVEAICCNDAVSLRRLLSKLRIYWWQSLASDWSIAYRGRLEQSNGHKALISGLVALLPRAQLIQIIKKYVPDETKIVWSETDPLVLSLRRHIAKNMHFARPQPLPDAVLWYAKGDYLQYALPSFSAIFYNLSSLQSREYIPKLLDAPVSIQKHGIRIASSKLKSEELKQIFSDLWKTTKNSSIRAVLFKQTYDLLCTEKNSLLTQEIWELLNMFIDDLSSDENKIIYSLLGKVNKVPISVRAKYCMKSYNYLKSLPAKANCENIIQKVVSYMIEIMDILDSVFVANILLEFIDKKFINKKNDYFDCHNMMHVMSSYLLCTASEKSQIQRYEKIIVPLIDRTLVKWDTIKDGEFYVRSNLKYLLNALSKDFEKHVVSKKMNNPITVFSNIQNKLEQSLPVMENYVMLKNWKLTVAFIKLLDDHKSFALDINTGDSNNDDNKKWNELYLKAVPGFGQICTQQLNEDVQSHFPSVYLLFSDALEQVFQDFRLHQLVQFETFIAMLQSKDSIQSYLLVLKMLPQYLHDANEKTKAKEIREMLFLHPSPELKMHYYQKFNENPDPYSVLL